MRFSLTVFISLLALNLMFIPFAGGKIVFRSSYHGNKDIYIMSSDGRNLRQLTFQLAHETAPVWSPNGRRIAFMRMHSERNWEIYMMNADGSNQRNLTNHPALDGDPYWSPDGRIGFVSNRDGAANLYVMNADGGNITPLTHHKKGEGSAYSPHWSPDGEEIAFAQVQKGHSREIYVLNIASKRERRLTHAVHGVWNFEPKWSPDGKKILYAAAVDGRVDSMSLMLTDKDGGHHEKVPVPEWELNADHSWSPSGREIVFSGREADGDWEIYRFHLKTHEVTNLTNRLGRESAPDWWNSNLPVEPQNVHLTRWGDIKSGGP